MIYAAEIDESGVVLRVIAVSSLDWCTNALGGNWLQTWKDGSQRGKFAGPGDTYDSVTDEFRSTQEDLIT